MTDQIYVFYFHLNALDILLTRVINFNQQFSMSPAASYKPGPQQMNNKVLI
jgi:hypothetical protein